MLLQKPKHQEVNTGCSGLK
uniref:Uncharacterized protein n=1 Tax=Lepeophtheirus salmonis TaxID=72036 RepID=A0A0K2V234_LEPSM